MPHNKYLWSCASLFVFLVFSLVTAQTSTQFSSPEAFASALLATATDAEREALLRAEPTLLTVTLRQVVLAQGDKFYSQRNWSQAFKAYQVARQIAAQINDQAGLASALHKIGTVYFSQNHLSQALDFFQQGLALRRTLNDQLAIFESLRNLGTVQRFLGNINASLAALHEAEALLPEIKETSAQAALDNALGLTYRALGDNIKSLSYARKALELYELGSDKLAIAGMQANIGNVYHSQGDEELARQYALKSLATSAAIPDKSLMSIAQNSLGNIYSAKGDYRMAMEFYQKSLQLKEEVKDALGISNTLSNIGRIYYRQGDYDQALRYLNQSLDSKRALGDKPGMGGVLINLGLIYREQQDYARAAKYLQESLQIGKETRNLEVVSESLNTLGTIYYEQGNPDQALATFKESLALRDSVQNKKGVSGSLGNLAFYYLLEQRPAEALQTAERAYALDQHSGSLEDLWYSLALKGHAYKMLGQTSQAQQAFAEAVEMIERLRTQAAGEAINQQNFMLKKLSPYHQLIDLLLNEAATDKALEYAERAKAGLLLSILQSGKVTITKAMSEAEKTEERLLKDHLNALTNQIERQRLRPKTDDARLADLQEQLKKTLANQQIFQAALYTRHPELKVQRGQPPPFRTTQAAALLTDKQTALLEYAATKDKVYLFVLTNSTDPARPILKAYELTITPTELDKAVSDFRALLASHNLVFRPSAAQLYDLLIKPAQGDLQGKTRLLIVPDATLWELPFQALQANDGSYLIEHFAISYAPSLALLVEMAKQRDRQAIDKKAPNLLAFANPALTIANAGNAPAQAAKPTAAPAADGANKFAPLPETEAEVKRLKTLYGARRSAIYTREEASEERLKSEAASYRILHLATHGILNNASPMYSQLVFSQAHRYSKDDGFLEAWEIAQLNLAADLVVLSACETARGRVNAGEGVIGLTWAFFVAGSSATLVSQWKVDEASTAALMVEFHRHLQTATHRAPGADAKAEALREATLKLLQNPQYRHPFYWAAFVLIGDAH
ncbi:MAG: CHAT domain-containing protein [Acidobacteria bacterium]|nr:CHAT domain-containing protein [Acidobacteriota bacterium]